MSLRHLVHALALLTAAGIAASACSGDDAPVGTPTQAPPTQASTGPTLLPSPLAGENIVDLAHEAPETTILGADSGDFLNDLPLLTSGDVNGDGLDDLLVGARFGDGPDNSREEGGEAYVIFGRGEMPGTIDLAAGDEDVTLFGAEAGDQFSFHGALGDVNGDGLADILVSAPFARGIGAVYVKFGATTLPSVIDYASVRPDALLLGPPSNGFFGDSVALSDVNGDGTDDIIVGTTFARRPKDLKNPDAQAGAVYVIFGGDQLTGVVDVGNGDQDVALYGENSDPHADEFGDTVLGADLNADGIGDIIVTAEAADGPKDDRSVCGEVHVFFGSPEIGGVLDVAEGDSDLTVWGAELNDTVGFNLGAGDVNHDGILDLLPTARGGDGPSNGVSEGGEVYVILGGSDLAREVDLLAGEGDAVIYGDTAADMLAYSIGVVSLSGRGDDLLMVGSGFVDGAPDRRDSGAVYILDAASLTGETPVSRTALALKIVGAGEGDGAGSAVTSGDFNGDGAAEIVLMATRADGPDDSREDAGEIYIVMP